MNENYYNSSGRNKHENYLIQKHRAQSKMVEKITTSLLRGSS